MLPQDAAEASDIFTRCLLASRAARGVTDQPALDKIAQQYRVDRAATSNASLLPLRKRRLKNQDTRCSPGTSSLRHTCPRSHF